MKWNFPIKRIRWATFYILSIQINREMLLRFGVTDFILVFDSAMNKLLLVAALLALLALASVPSVAAETQVEEYKAEGFVCDCSLPFSALQCESVTSKLT